MRYYFTKRHHSALRDKKLKPSLPTRLRISLRQLLSNLSDYDGDPGVSENLTFTRAEKTLKMFYGQDHLLAFNSKGQLVPSSVWDVIDNGLPDQVLDLIEAWCDSVTGETANILERELNILFEIHNSHWRLVNRTIILMDSQYVQEEIVSKTQYLLKEASASGALEEFNEAVSFLTSGQTKEAIIYAHKSVESVMKTCLGVEKAKFGALLSKLVKSGIIPDYYEEFLVYFEKIVMGAAKERNQPARGHGQGAAPTGVERSLAEFAVHLAGTVDLFIIRRWIEARPKKEKHTEDGNIPF